MSKNNEKAIRVAIRNGDDTKVKVAFHGDIFTPTEFTSMFMAVLETYTTSLLTTNSREDIFNHFNNAFGIFLNKLVKPSEHYKLSKEHKEFKEVVDATLGQKETPEMKKETEDNRLAAWILCRDVLCKEFGLTEESADLLINKRLGLITELKTPTSKGGEVDETK